MTAFNDLIAEVRGLAYDPAPYLSLAHSLRLGRDLLAQTEADRLSILAYLQGKHPDLLRSLLCLQRSQDTLDLLEGTEGALERTLTTLSRSDGVLFELHLKQKQQRVRLLTQHLQGTDTAETWGQVLSSSIVPVRQHLAKEEHVLHAQDLTDTLVRAPRSKRWVTVAFRECFSLADVEALKALEKAVDGRMPPRIYWDFGGTLPGPLCEEDRHYLWDLVPRLCKHAGKDLTVSTPHP